MACAGDIPTQEALAAVAILRERFPDLKIRFVNVVDLFKLQPDSNIRTALRDRDFDSLFTSDKPIIFNFHGYPWLIHSLTYRRTTTTTCMSVATRKRATSIRLSSWLIRNESTVSTLAIDVIDRVPSLQGPGAHLKEWLKGQIIENINYAYSEGIDKPEIRNRKWPAAKQKGATQADAAAKNARLRISRDLRTLPHF